MKKISGNLVLAVAALGLAPLAHAFDRDDGPVICGTAADDSIWCTSVRGMEHGHWERIPGALKQVIVRERQLWGVNREGEIWYAADFRNPNWVRLEGRAKEISEGHGVLCVVNDRDEIYCATAGITGPHPEWHRSPNGSKLSFISVD